MSTLNGIEIDDLDVAVDRALPALKALSGGSLFVTGGTGFIGQWLLALIIRASQARSLAIDVTVLTRSVARFSALCPELAAHRAVRLTEGDVRFFEFPKGRFSHLIHAATDASVAADNEPLRLMDTVASGTRRALEFALVAGVRRFLFVSSGAIYGPQPAELATIPEDYAGACASTDRRSAYGQAKRFAEQLTTVCGAVHGLEAVIVRVFATVGPGLPLDAHFAIGNFIRDAIGGKRIVVQSDGTPVRSYLYAGDLAVWLLRLLVEGRPGAAYNVGSDKGLSIAELAERVATTISGSDSFEVRGVAQPAGHRSRYVPAIDRARRELGLDAWTPLEQAILRTARWARRREIEGVLPLELHRNEHAAAGKTLTFVVDLDGVIASLTPGNNYNLAAPLTDTIGHINRLYDAGHRIVLFTARGSATGDDWSEVTYRQLADWGVKYHEIRFGKPAADYYVDDRLLSISELANFAEALT